MSSSKLCQPFFVAFPYFCYCGVSTCCKMGFRALCLSGCSKQPSRVQTSCRALQRWKSESLMRMVVAVILLIVKEIMMRGTLEEVVGHLLGHRVVEGLSHLDRFQWWLFEQWIKWIIRMMKNLVDQPHEVSIRPAGFVQVVRLLQHLGQLLAPNIPGIQHSWGTHVLRTQKLRHMLCCYCKVKLWVLRPSHALLWKKFWRFLKFWQLCRQPLRQLLASHAAADSCGLYTQILI